MLIKRMQRSPKTAEKTAQNIGSPQRKETQQLPETAEKQLRTRVGRDREKCKTGIHSGRPTLDQLRTRRGANVEEQEARVRPSHLTPAKSVEQLGSRRI